MVLEARYWIRMRMRPRVVRDSLCFLTVSGVIVSCAHPLKGANAWLVTVFGQTMLLFSLEKLRIYNIVFLVTVPIGTVLLVVCQRLAATREWGAWRTEWDVWRPNHGFGWLKFWAALVLTVAAQTILVLIHLVWNPYVSPPPFSCSTSLILSAQIVYSSAYLVVLSALSLTFLTLLFPLSASLPQRFHCRLLDGKGSTSSVLLQLHILSYILLLLPTTLLPTTLGGTYPLTILATCVFVGWAVGVIGQIILDLEPPSTFEGPTEQVGEEEENGGPRVRFEPPPPAAVEEPLNGAPASSVEVEPTETTPLIPRPHSRRLPGGVPTLPRFVPLLWLPQFLIVVPFPVILFANIGVLLIGSTSQTVVDGGPVWVGE